VHHKTLNFVPSLPPSSAVHSLEPLSDATSVLYYLVFNLDSSQITYLLGEKACRSVCVVSLHVQLLVRKLEH